MTTGPRSARADAWLDRLIDALALVAGVMLCLLTAMICVDVAARNFRLFPMPWTLDLAEYALYLITFLGAPWVLREGGHIAIDILIDHLAPRARRRAVLLSHVVGAVVCAVLLYYACRTWWRSFSGGTLVHETFVFPEWILLSVAPPTFAILLAVFLRRIARPRASAAETRPDGL